MSSGSAGHFATSLRPSDRLAERFEVVRALGSGAMGEVYEALDLELGARVALKVLRPEITEDPEQLRRFRREVHLARQVTHPNVCRLFDLFHAASPQAAREDDSADLAAPSDLVFITLELVDGESLSERIARAGPLPDDELHAVLSQVAAGLDAAHRAQIVHRDFKSANVLLASAAAETGSPRAVVTDFGLARSAEVVLTADPAESTLTSTGSILGSPAYMAPEQVRGEQVTAASDVYAFGIVAFEAATGRLPFAGGTAFQIALRRLSEDPPCPSSLAPSLDPRWDRAILACLAREPEDRPASASAAIALANAPADAEVQAKAKAHEERAAPRRRISIRVARIGAAALLAVAALAFWRFGSDSQGAASSASSALFAEGQKLLVTFDVAAAVDQLEKAAANDPNNPRIQSALAAALSARGSEAAALVAARRGFELSASLAESERWPIEARYRALAHELPAAIALYSKRLAAEPSDLDSGLALAGVQITDGQLAGAQATLAALRRLPAPRGLDPRIDLLAADAARAAGDSAAQRSAAMRAAERARAIGAPQIVARARFFEAYALRQLGQPKPALAAAEAARDLATTGNNRTLEALAWKEIGALRTLDGDLGGALEAFTRTVAASEAVGARRIALVGLNGRAIVLRRLGRLDEAAQTFDQLLEIQRDLGHPSGEAAAKNGQALVLLQLGRLAEAENALDQAREIFFRLGDKSGEGTTQLNRCGLLTERGDLAAARSRCQSALELFRAAEEPSALPEIQIALARIDRLAGEFDAARSRLDRIEKPLRELGDESVSHAARLERAQLEFDDGRLDRAAMEARAAFSAATAATASPAAAAEAAALLARVLAEAGDRAGSQRALADSYRSLAGDENLALHLRRAMVAARGADDARARAALDSAQQEAQVAGLLPLALELRLERARRLSATGEIASELAAIAREARRAGLGTIARAASRPR